MTKATPRIVYVPGLMPKPPAAKHRGALQNSLAAGLRLVGADTSPAEALELYAWNFGFYGEDRPWQLDMASVAALLASPAAGEAERRDAVRPGLRLSRWLFRAGNALPFLVPHFATDRQRLHIRDLNAYARNDAGAATRIRSGLKTLLREPSGAPLLLIGHSMGSIICWDTLWDADHGDNEMVPVSLFLTMGSPLGQRYVRERLLGHRAKRDRRFPAGIGRWINLAATGDMTSLGQRLASNFARYYRDATPAIEDHEIVNAFRLDGVISPHSEYGYLANPVTAGIISEWWQTAGGQPDARIRPPRGQAG